MPKSKYADTIMRRKFTKALIKHKGNATQALLEIKPNLKIGSARSMSSEYLAKTDLSSNIRDILDNEGVTDKYIAEVLKGALSADKTQDTSEGLVTSPDWTNRNTAIVTALKTKGHLRDGAGTVNIQIGTSIQSADELARIERLMSDAKMILGKLGYLDKQTAQEADVSRETNGQVVEAQDVT